MHKFILIILMTAMAVNFVPVFAVIAQSRPQSNIFNVQYTSQAPFGDWSDRRQMYGCEEASVAMAMAWARGGGGVPPDEFLRDIINMSEYEKVIYGFFEDTSAQDTARLITDIYQHTNIIVKENISSEDIKQELASNRLVLVPLNTRLTGLSVYRYGPVRHMIVAIGYDDASDSIIVHDPLFPSGQYMWIPSAALNNALWNYQSGVLRPLGPKHSTALISVGKTL